MANVMRGPWEGTNLDGGRYQQLTTLGAGGMGYVYRAFDVNLQTHVVIKTPRTSLAGDPRYVERFEREIRALVRLSFPHIVPVIDVGRHQGAVYAVMRYLSGGSLASRVALGPDGRPRPMPLESLRGWFPAIVKALDFIHGAGYVHRDVKPANILFDEHGQAYLSDFGIIKIVGDTSSDAARGTDEQTVLGSVDYMAPEILGGGSFDGRADQYALAITTFELLAGRLPFGGDTVQAVMQAHLNETPPQLKQLVPGIPRSLSDAVARALAKSPAQRHANCATFARAMKDMPLQAEMGTPVPEPPPPSRSNKSPPPLPTPRGAPAEPPPALPRLPRISPPPPAFPAAVLPPSAFPQTAVPPQPPPTTAHPNPPPPQPVVPQSDPSRPYVAQPYTAQPYTAQPYTAQPYAPNPYLAEPYEAQPVAQAAAPPYSQPATPPPAASSTAPLARSRTLEQPLAPSKRDTDRIPLPGQAPAPSAAPPHAAIVGPAPMTGPGPAAGPAPMHAPVFAPPAAARRSRMPIVVGSVIALLLAVGAAFMIAGESDSGGFAGFGANPLPRRLSEWKKKADDLEKSLVIDSAPILKEAAYADAAGLEALLADAASGRVNSATAKIDELAVELKSMADALDERRRLVAKRKDEADPPGESVARELNDLESQLLTHANQLNALRQTAESPRGAYDSDAVAELTVLRALEAAVASDDPPAVEPATLDRAAVLLTSRNAALAFRAWNTLLRAGDRRGLDAVETRFDAAPLDRRPALLWSMLVAARPVMIDAALARLRRQPDLADKFDPKTLPALAEKNPALYEQALPLLAARVVDADARFRLAVVQMRVMKDAWTGEIEEACRTGLLRDRVGDLAAKIISERLTAAYPLAKKLLAEHRALRFDALTGDEFKSLAADAPDLAGMLGEAWIVRGTPEQRRAALADYGSAGSPIAPARLLERLKREPPAEPSELINALLPRTQPQAAELAEFLLSDPDVLQPDRIAFAGASPEILARPSARAALFAAAWKSQTSGRPWVLRELLGPEFARKFSEAESERDRQLEIIGRVVPVLSGKFVNKPGVTNSYSLPVPRREIPGLPSEIETARWAPDSPARRNLAELRSQAAAAAEKSPPAYKSAIDSFVRYVEDLDYLTVASHEIARVYDATIVQQLPGAQRGLKLNTVSEWEFIFPAAYVDLYRREDTRYRGLAASLPTSRSALPWKSDNGAPAEGKDAK